MLGILAGLMGPPNVRPSNRWAAVPIAETDTSIQFAKGELENFATENSTCGGKRDMNPSSTGCKPHVCEVQRKASCRNTLLPRPESPPS